MSPDSGGTPAIPFLNFRNTAFVTSAANIHQLPRDQGIEIAFVGRSNSGKSSSINAICGQKNLAKTSRTPGRTRLINLFRVDQGKFLVDLPGYGYAAVPRKMKLGWQKSLSEYLQKRLSLRGLVLTMDIRTPLRPHDRLIIDWSLAANLPVLILLTKADKLGINVQRAAVRETLTLLSEFRGNFKVIAFSALKGTGVGQASAVLRTWFALSPEIPSDSLPQSNNLN